MHHRFFHPDFRAASWLLSLLPLAFASAAGAQSTDVLWVEDSVPAGATVAGDGEGWNWVSANPTPFSGVAHQSNLVSGIHQHYFHSATSTLTVNAGDVLVAYVYLDPANPPSQVMLQWNDGTWEHRAYWGANQIPWGVDGTSSRRAMGALPVAGQWVRLEVPAGLVGLEGRTLNGMAFTLVNGRATWDHAGKLAPSSGPITMSILAHPMGSKNDNYRIQATGFSVSALPDVFRVHGTAGYQQIKWNAAQTGLDNLYHGTTPYPDFPTLSGRQDCAHTKDPRLWDPRCGTDVVGYFWKRVGCPPTGQVACQDNDRWNASPGRYNVTPFATPGIWPRSDDFGTTNYTPIIDQAKINNVQLQPADTSCARPAGDTIWVADVLPRGAVAAGSFEGWSWVSTPGVSGASPVPFPGKSSHQSALLAGMHQHYFTNAASTLTVNAGDVLVAYIYLDPASPPSQVMLQWNDGTWDHRAYWGANQLPWGVDGTNSRRRMGALPAAGQWVRLEVPASLVGLEGRTLNGMAFSLFNGRATWDHAGKWTPAAQTGFCPPKTGSPQLATFHAYNPDEYATGAANSKAVQVTYADGTSRWFMAFNSMIKHVSVTYTDANGAKKNDSGFGRSAADNWRVMWATSADGVTWTVHPQVLFRSVTERDLPWTGLLVTDMLIDNGHFYMLFQDLLQPHLYLARARIDPVNSATGPGYIQTAAEGWSLASHPIQSGQYTWKRVAALGQQLDFAQLGAAPVMPAIESPLGGFVKQGSLARIFTSAAPNSPSRIFGVTNDGATVQLWSAADLTQPLEYESDVWLDPSIATGGNGWEFGFSHYTDNVPATPRIVGTGFFVWVAEQAPGAHVLVTRRNAQLSGF